MGCKLLYITEFKAKEVIKQSVLKKNTCRYVTRYLQQL